LRDELAAAMRWGRGAAQTRIDHARQLTDVLPGTLAALRAGRISPRFAAEFVYSTADLTGEAAAVVEHRVLPKAPDLTLAKLKQRLRRAVAAADTRTFAEAHAKAVKGRRVELWPQPDGMATVAATLPATDAQTVMLALDRLARIPDTPTPDTDAAEAATGGEADRADLTDAAGAAPGEGTEGEGKSAAGAEADDERGIDARRADALVALAEAALERPELPRAHGRKVAVQVVIDLPTLLGLTQTPAELVGYGPIPAPLARALAADAAWTRLVTEPVTGHLLDYGSTQYRPPQVLQDFLIARDRTCRAPSCGQPAHRCELDHHVPYPAGRTSAGNLSPFCKHDHLNKTHAGWHVTRNPDGSLTWTTPLGRTHTVEQPDHRLNPDPPHPAS
jgi:hypothetical protein